MTPAAALSAVAFGTALTVLGRLALGRLGRRVTNFRGDSIPAGYGVYVAAWGCSLPLGLLAAGTEDDARSLAAALLVAAGVLGALGFVDDAFGAHGAGGFAGHLRALVRGRRVTTGLLKAAGGGLASIGAAWLLHRGGVPGPVLLADAIVIALFANFINLLDLRPGRAGWAFLVLWAALCGAGLVAAPGGKPFGLMTLPAVLALLVLLPGDSKGRRIMGDSGSNPLGGILGVGVCALLPLPGRLACLALLTGVHIYAERRSLSVLIESVPLLRVLDRLTGIR